MTELKVIDAGLCPLGTYSTRKALIDMGYSNCYQIKGKNAIKLSQILEVSQARPLQGAKERF
jgi:hypothetical protein